MESDLTTPIPPVAQRAKQVAGLLFVLAGGVLSLSSLSLLSGMTTVSFGPHAQPLWFDLWEFGGVPMGVAGIWFGLKVIFRALRPAGTV